MTLYQLTSKLQAIIDREPSRGKLEVYVYFTDLEDTYDGFRTPQPILLVDNSVSDRIDINI